MANVTDPLIRSLQGSDPQNAMEYIVRQKIYETRYWKEECFGLSAADVLEKASELKCIGGSFGPNAKPTKFLCLALKLLQLQPNMELIEQFIAQDHCKPWQRFSEDVRWIFRTRDVFEAKPSTGYRFTYAMVGQCVPMFRQRRMRNSRTCHYRLVITKQPCGAIKGHTKGSQRTAEVNSPFSCLPSHYEFRTVGLLSLPGSAAC